MTDDNDDIAIVCDRLIGLTTKISDALDRAVALHNACETSQGHPPTRRSELAAVLADYLLWKFGKDGIAAVEHQGKALRACGIGKYIGLSVD